MPDELQDFLKDLPQEDKTHNLLNENLMPEAPEKEEKAEQVAHNRRERRENKQLQWEREARIKAEARLEALSEVQKFSQETGVDERLARLYGTDNKEAIALHQAMREDDRRIAKEEAVAEMEAKAKQQADEVRQNEGYLDSKFEEIEDEHNVDLTSNSPAARKNRNDLIAMIQKLSPKDEDGNITAYADIEGAWEQVQAQKEKKDTTRNKDIASRGMTSSGTADTTKLAEDATRAWLKSQGINV